MMNIVKNCLHNQIEERWMDDYPVACIENDIFKTLSSMKNSYSDFKI
jgi:hypothetical protein